MIALFTIIHVIISVFLILIVLIQSGKGAMMGANLGAGQQLFGGSGGKTFFTRATGVLIALFMANCIWIAWLQEHVHPASDLKSKLQSSMPVAPAPPGGSPLAAFGTPGAQNGSPVMILGSPIAITTAVTGANVPPPAAKVPMPEGAKKPK